MGGGATVGQRVAALANAALACLREPAAAHALREWGAAYGLPTVWYECVESKTSLPPEDARLVGGPEWLMVLNVLTTRKGP